MRPDKGSCLTEVPQCPGLTSMDKAQGQTHSQGVGRFICPNECYPVSTPGRARSHP